MLGAGVLEPGTFPAGREEKLDPPPAAPAGALELVKDPRGCTEASAVSQSVESVSRSEVSRSDVLVAFLGLAAKLTASEGEMKADG